MSDLHTLAPAQEENPAHVDKRGRLPAEQKFDKWVYGGISYFAQAATGTALTYWIRNGSGRKYYDAMARWFGPNVLSKITPFRGADAVKAADSWIVISTMIMVGNAFLLPVKGLENRKSQIVRDMTEKDNERREARGETISAAEREAQQEHLAVLDAKPRQSWWSLLGGRGFGLGVVYAVNYAMGLKPRWLARDFNKTGEELFTKAVTGSIDAAGLRSAAQSKPMKDIAGIAFYDAFYSTVSASGLYFYSHFIHPFKKHASPTDEVLPPLEEAVLEVVNGAPARQRSAGLPSPSMQVESIAHPQPQLAEVRA